MIQPCILSIETDNTIKEFVISGLTAKYELTIKDPLTTVLGLEVVRIPHRRVQLRQRAHILGMFKEFLSHWESLPLDQLPVTPMRTNHAPLTAEMARLKSVLLSPSEIKRFERIVGDVMWCLHTSLDATYAINVLSKLQRNPTKCDEIELNRILLWLAYVIRTDSDGLILGGESGVSLVTTVDSSYYGNRDFTSQCGATFHSSPTSGAFSVMSKTPKIAADSSMAIEGIGGHLAVRRVIPLRYFLE
jgi:hypothetical protein